MFHICANFGCLRSWRYYRSCPEVLSRKGIARLWINCAGYRLGWSDDIGHVGSLLPSTPVNRPRVCCLFHPCRWRVHGICYPEHGASRNGLIFFLSG